MPKVLCRTLPNFIEVTFRHGCSPVNLLHIFITAFPKNTSGRLFLIYVISKIKLREVRDLISWVLG